MAISLFPDARFTTPIELPGSSGPALRDAGDDTTWNQGQSVVTLRGFTYVFLTTGSGGDERISVWTDNPAFVTSTDFDKKEDLVSAGGSPFLVTARGRSPKAFTDGVRLYLSYQQHDGTDFREERFAICPNPDTDLLSAANWFHLDLTTSVTAAGPAFMLVPKAASIGALTELRHPGSLHIQDGYVLTCWLGRIGTPRYINLVIGQVGSATWDDSIELFDDASGGAAIPIRTVIKPRDPICFRDRLGYVHVFFRYGRYKKVYHARSSGINALDIYSLFRTVPMSLTSSGQGVPYASALTVNGALWGGVGSDDVHSTTCITPDGHHGLCVGQFDHAGDSNNTIYANFRLIDDRRDDNPWQKITGDFSNPNNPNIILVGFYKGHHVNLQSVSGVNSNKPLGDWEDIINDPGDFVFETQNAEGSYAFPEVRPITELAGQEAPAPATTGPIIGRAMGINHYNIRAVANAQPRRDSTGFFLYRTRNTAGVGIEKQRIDFIHINTSGRIAITTMAEFSTGSGSPRPLAEVHTIWMSNSESLKPVVFGETDGGHTSQGKYWITFLGGVAPLPNERGVIAKSTLDPIQAYTEA